jgi:hypothetical protein
VPKRLYRLARSRAVPKGRPEAKRSGHPRRAEVEKHRAAKRFREVAFALQNQEVEQQKTGLSDMSIKTDGNQHKGGTHGKSQRWQAWHWRLTEQSVDWAGRALLCQSSPDRLYNDLQSRGDCLNTRKSYKTSHFVGWVVG